MTRKARPTGKRAARGRRKRKPGAIYLYPEAQAGPPQPPASVSEPPRKVAFVLSGGGNRGPLEVGAMLALLEHNIHPQILVGTSVGAINAAAAAGDLTPDGLRRLAGTWVEIANHDVLTSRIGILWRIITRKEGLIPSEKLKRLVEEHIPPNMRFFYDIQDVELYIVAANLNTLRMHVFGLDKTESVVDAIMASSALPPYFAPWYYRGQQYVDGVVVADLPVRVALKQGADEVYAVDLGYSGPVKQNVSGLFNIVRRSIKTMTQQQIQSELDYPGESSESQGRIHHIVVKRFYDLPLWDLSYTSQMIDEGHRVAEEYLSTISQSRAV